MGDEAGAVGHLAEDVGGDAGDDGVGVGVPMPAGGSGAQPDEVGGGGVPLEAAGQGLELPGEGGGEEVGGFALKTLGFGAVQGKEVGTRRGG